MTTAGSSEQQLNFDRCDELTRIMRTIFLYQANPVSPTISCNKRQVKCGKQITVDKQTRRRQHQTIIKQEQSVSRVSRMNASPNRSCVLPPVAAQVFLTWRTLPPGCPINVGPECYCLRRGLRRWQRYTATRVLDRSIRWRARL